MNSALLLIDMHEHNFKQELIVVNFPVIFSDPRVFHKWFSFSDVTITGTSRPPLVTLDYEECWPPEKQFAILSNVG